MKVIAQYNGIPEIRIRKYRTSGEEIIQTLEGKPFTNKIFYYFAFDLWSINKKTKKQEEEKD